MVYGAKLRVEDGGEVALGQPLVEWDPYTFAILTEIGAALKAKGGAMIVTADHGNCEMMVDPVTGGPHTAHTVNPVPVILVGGPAGATLRQGGRTKVATVSRRTCKIDRTCMTDTYPATTSSHRIRKRRRATARAREPIFWRSPAAPQP